MIKLIKKYEEIIRYLIIGVLTTVVSLASYYTCVHTFLDANNKIELQIANIIAWIISVTFAYFTNRSFVFKSENQNKIKECISFYTSRISTLLIDMGLMYLFVSALHYNDTIIKIIVQFVVVILNYVLSKLLVFRKQ